MNIEQTTIRHGEVILKPVDTLPKKAVLEQETHSLVVAHSETGHHHVLQTKSKIDTSKIKVYSLDGDTYLEVLELSELFHQKTGKDVHTPHKVVPNVYKVIIKKEFDYFAKVIREVRD